MRESRTLLANRGTDARDLRERLLDITERRLESRVKKAQTRRRMRELGLRSPASKVGGIVYFGRLIDKIRQHVKGQLPSDYQANLGRGFDSACTTFLRIDYNRLVERVKQDRKSTRLNSSHSLISYAVFCLKKKKKNKKNNVKLKSHIVYCIKKKEKKKD